MNYIKSLGKTIIRLNEVASTNDYVRNLVAENRVQNGDIVIADFQSGGKGQDGNIWESTSGENLLFSIFLSEIKCKAEDQFLLSKIISLGICDYLNQEKEGFVIKWPNDIYFKNQKISGILIENTIQSNNIKSSIIGIGINISQTIFSDSIPNPISLKNINDKDFYLEKELDKLLVSLNKWLYVLEIGDIQLINEAYVKMLFLINEKNEYIADGISFSGIIKGVDNYGRLIIEEETGNRRVFSFKEVEFVI